MILFTFVAFLNEYKHCLHQIYLPDALNILNRRVLACMAILRIGYVGYIKRKKNIHLCFVES